jgi:uncharacterized protein
MNENEGWGRGGGWGQQQGPAPGWGQPTPGQQPGMGPYHSPGAMPPDGLHPDEKMWGMLAHLSPLVVGIFGPVLLMFIDPVGQRPSAFIKFHAKQALLWCVAMIVVGVLTCGFGAIVMMVWQVLAGIAAHRGEWYVYPGLGSFAERPVV